MKNEIQTKQVPLSLKNGRHIQQYPFKEFMDCEAWGGFTNMFDLPTAILVLQNLYYGWIRDNAAELTAMLQDAACSHLMENEDGESESIELYAQVSHNDEQWTAYIDRDGIKLSYADPEYEGEDWFSWGDLETETDLLGQVITDAQTRKLLTPEI